MTRSTPAREDGFTLIELLVVMSLFMLILGATLDTMIHFTRDNQVAERRNDQAELARTALDRQARQLRNLAKRVLAPTINKATDYDLIFQTSDPQRTWVRYCLDTTHPPASPSHGRLWEMVSPAASVPDSGACPGSTGSWAQAQVVADQVVNTNGGANRPVFSYSCLNGATPCPPADNSTVTGVGATLYIDDDVTRLPPELRVATWVYLRNQNEPPTADFSASAVSTRKVFLNASASSDPEGRTLRFYWYPTGGAPSFNCATGPPTSPTYYQGLTLNYTYSSSTPVASQVPATLVVCDPGDLQAIKTKQVTVP